VLRLNYLVNVALMVTGVLGLFLRLVHDAVSVVWGESQAPCSSG
jgi:hypothetical protein